MPVGRAATLESKAQALVKALGDTAARVSVTPDPSEERIMVRLDQGDVFEVTEKLKRAGVKEQDTGIRTIHDYQGTEVAISPYQSAFV